MKNSIIAGLTGIAISLLFAFQLPNEVPVSKDLARVNSFQGLLIFSDCKPIQEYEYLGSVKSNGGFGSAQYEPVRDRLIKKCKKEYPEANGLILHLMNGKADRADAVKFK